MTGAVLCQRLHLWCMPPETNRTGDTHGHDALPSVIFSEGPGAEAFRGMMENYEIPGKLARLCGVDWPPRDR